VVCVGQAFHIPFKLTPKGDNLVDELHLPTTLRKCPKCMTEWFEDEYDDRIITCPGCRKEFLAGKLKIIKEE
jgi:DNA-directed RNA polymerase subunit RPC12/RpoP